MVNSNLDKSINYPELSKIDIEDQKYFLKATNCATFDIIKDGIDIEITVGKPKYSFSKKSVIYFIVYLVIDDIVDTPIGIYEIMEPELLHVYDEDGDIDLNKLSEPRYYSYSTELLIEEKEKEKEKEKENPVTIIDDDVSVDDDSDNDDSNDSNDSNDDSNDSNDDSTNDDSNDSNDDDSDDDSYTAKDFAPL